jgi:ribonucleoside-diphosphate reductase alpha chain
MPVADTGKSLWDIKQSDFNFPAPLDMTNISVNYDTDWLLKYYDTGDPGNVFKENVKQALKSAEPGFSFNFFDKENETLRNACTEVTSEDDSDVCNLGSLNFGRIGSISELKDVVRLATMFLICGTLKADLPYDKVKVVRWKNRRLGLGLMGMHEWLIQRGYKYEVTPELHNWLSVYKGESDKVSKEFADRLSITRPVANRAIAPTGSIGILAGTSTGIEPIFAVAYKRRYLKGGNRWHYQYVVDSAAQELIDRYGANPENVESALDLADDYERRIKFQADVQDYVDMSISSTINLPAWGSKLNNEDTVDKFSHTLASYAHRLRGFTCYPDGSRGGQPLTSVPYQEAVDKLGEEFEEHVEAHDICDISGTGGTCGV